MIMSKSQWKRVCLQHAKYQKEDNRQNPRTNGKNKAIQTKSHEVHRLNFGMICCLFRYSRVAGHITLIVSTINCS